MDVPFGSQAVAKQSIATVLSGIFFMSTGLFFLTYLMATSYVLVYSPPYLSASASGILLVSLPPLAQTLAGFFIFKSKVLRYGVFLGSVSTFLFLVSLALFLTSNLPPLNRV